MFHHVSLQVGFLAEGGVTEMAGELALPAVDVPQMPLQVGGDGEGSPTEGAAVRLLAWISTFNLVRPSPGHLCASGCAW